jgi:hypothetical protein
LEQHQNGRESSALEEYQIKSTYKAQVKPQEDLLAQGWRALKAGAKKYREANKRAAHERQIRSDPRVAIATAETLDEAIIRLSRQGFVVVFRSEKQAKLRRKKRLNWSAVIGHAICTTGISLIPHLLIYMRQRDKIVHLMADETGHVHEA